MAFVRKMTSQPVSKVEIRVKCTGLQNKDLTSKSDPCCVLFLKTRGDWTEICRTERIDNTLNPEFVTPLALDYMFEEVQTLKFSIYDLDNSSKSVSDDDFLGEHEITLGQLVSSRNVKKPLQHKKHKKDCGMIMLNAEEVGKLNENLEMHFRACRLDNKDTFGKSDPFLLFSRSLSDGSWQVVHRTEYVKNSLNPDWKSMTIGVEALCGGDFEREIKVECFDYDSDGGHDLIGCFNCTVNKLLEATNAEVEFPCINHKKKEKKKNYTNSGLVILTKCLKKKEYSFLDFIFGGLQLNFTVGIDFTGSNGHPQDPNSLHFINLQHPNEYIMATMAVGSVIQDYDSDQLFPALGFGARVPPNFEVSHEFPINFQPSNPFCAGVHGIVEAYKACVSQVQLYGPTNFSPIIQHVAKFGEQARQQEGARNYYVLLILTDGIITDMEETKAALIHASNLPMSVIIIGVGQADFDAMNELDGDDGVLKDSYGNKARRDIVQFVPFRKFAMATTDALAKQVLAEVPRQVCDYFKMMGITPQPPKQPAT